MASTFTNYEIVRDNDGWTITHDGDEFGTGLSREEAEGRVWLLQRIGAACDLLMEVEETVMELPGPDHYRTAGVVSEVVFNFYENVKGTPDPDSPLHYLLNGPPVRSSRRRGEHS